MYGGTRLPTSNVEFKARSNLPINAEWFEPSRLARVTSLRFRLGDTVSKKWAKRSPRIRPLDAKPSRISLFFDRPKANHHIFLPLKIGRFVASFCRNPAPARLCQIQALELSRSSPQIVKNDPQFGAESRCNAGFPPTSAFQRAFGTMFRTNLATSARGARIRIARRDVRST